VKTLVRGTCKAREGGEGGEGGEDGRAVPDLRRFRAYLVAEMEPRSRIYSKMSHYFESLAALFGLGPDSAGRMVDRKIPLRLSG